MKQWTSAFQQQIPACVLAGTPPGHRWTMMRPLSGSLTPLEDFQARLPHLLYTTDGLPLVKKSCHGFPLYVRICLPALSH